MVAVKLEGRLGNQLFQYAFIYATAQKLGTGFYIDKSIEDFIPAKYFEIKHDFFKPLDTFIFSIEGFKNIFKIHAKKTFYKMLHRLLLYNKTIVFDNHQMPSAQFTQIKNGYLYKGHFQSETYFESNKADIRKLLTIKNQHVKLFNEILHTLPEIKKIVIHIRRSDYVDLNLSLPLSYYKKALNDVNYKEGVCIFISDDPQYIEQEFRYIENKYISDNTEIVDLQFLINADICILSNSSFSWWGAWLNNKPGKIIYGPKNWLGFRNDKEYPIGISTNLAVHWIN